MGGMVGMRGSGRARLVALGTTLVLVVAACGGPATSVEPSASAAAPTASSAPTEPSETLQPSIPVPSSTPEPTPTTEPTIDASTYFYPRELEFANGFVMRVAVSDLNVRRKPSTK